MLNNDGSAQDEGKIFSETLGPCSFTVVAPTVVNTTDPVVGVVPVVLQELRVQVDILSEVTLEEPAIEIKRVKNRLKITQCRLLQPTGKLFIRGFVRQNIEYATAPSDSTARAACGDIVDCVVDIPFECLTPITTFINPPIFGGFNVSGQFEYGKVSSLPKDKFPEKESLLAGDSSEFNQQTTEMFTPLPYCVLIGSTVTHFLEFIDRQPLTEGPFEEATFTRMEEKIDVELILKLLQEQQVCVGASAACG